MSKEYPMDFPALSVDQPLGRFFITKISARVLLDITYSNPLRVTQTSPSGLGYFLGGGQRTEKPTRLQEIARYIGTVEAAFPNSIILGANYDENGELVEDEENEETGEITLRRKWRVERPDYEGLSRLIVPTKNRFASIIDGQHRLHAFRDVDEERQSMELLCAVYLDLPNPYQAYLFATINFNQRPVDRSLAYEMFGFDVENEPEISWAPDKTAVLISRKLNTTNGSPFNEHIVIAAADDDIVFKDKPSSVSWAISMATVVDGSLRLFSSNPKRDKDTMHIKSVENGRSRKDLPDDSSPLRQFYKDENDVVIYAAVANFFLAVDTVFWSQVDATSYLKKTVGIQAFFDVLRELLLSQQGKINISQQFFELKLQKARQINFAEIAQSSGIGRARIRKAILNQINLV